MLLETKNFPHFLRVYNIEPVTSQHSYFSYKIHVIRCFEYCEESKAYCDIHYLKECVLCIEKMRTILSLKVYAMHINKRVEDYSS